MCEESGLVPTATGRLHTGSCKGRARTLSMDREDRALPSLRTLTTGQMING